MSKPKTITIEYTTTSMQKCEKVVPESEAVKEAERLRTLPDIRTGTVKLRTT